MYSVCICSWWWDVHTCIYFVSSVVFVDFLIKSSSQKKLGWPILSKRRKDARLILFYKIINNLAQVPHEHILIKAYEGTRKKNNHKFRHIAVNTSQYRQSFSPKTVGPWNQLSFADSPTLENFRINLMSTNRP